MEQAMKNTLIKFATVTLLGTFITMCSAVLFVLALTDPLEKTGVAAPDTSALTPPLIEQQE